MKSSKLAGSLVLLAGLLTLLTACGRRDLGPTLEPSPTAAPLQASPTAQVIVETVVVAETVVVVVTPTAVTETPNPSATPSATAVAQPTETPAPPTVPAATPTRPPATPAPAPTATPAPGPTILFFQANVTTADPGQTIQLEWSTVGAATATIGRIWDFRISEIWSVPPSGSYTYTIHPMLRNQVSFILTVEDSGGRRNSSQLNLPLTCPDPWFFTPAPDSCAAGPARVSAGAEQRFANGYMLWEAAERRIYILYTSGHNRWQIVSDSWQEGEPICQIEPVPPGYVHPGRGFGKVWCEDANLRERLGWALGSEMGGYQTAVQTTAFSRYNRIYVRAADGGVWVLLPEGSSWEKLPPP
jgi:hypothetical protein